jgi:hypothetical protein
LHDGDISDKTEPFLKDSKQSKNEEEHPRNALRSNWAKYTIWYKPQPLDRIRDYFGGKDNELNYSDQ